MRWTGRERLTGQEAAVGQAKGTVEETVREQIIGKISKSGGNGCRVESVVHLEHRGRMEKEEWGRIRM